MGVRDVLRKAASSLLGISAYAPPGPSAIGPSEATVDKLRKAFGGQLQPQPQTITRWYLSDLETAEFEADGGVLQRPALLMRSARGDGVLAGVLSTRTGGLVRLPKKFRGDPEVIAELELGHESIRSTFDEMYPPAELEQLAGDGVLLGVGVGERVPVVGRPYPVFVRLDPSYLVYRWNEARWYYSSIAGLIPITPGDGRWVLHTPGGRSAPWQHGAWRAIGRSFIRKEHAALYKDSWEAKLANPARVAYAPQGGVEEQRETFFRQVMAWGVNTVFGLTPGYEVKLLESNGRGYESFEKTIADQNEEMIICIAGQTVTTDGGVGFANSDIHKSIRADLIKATADGLAYTLNTQGIPPFIAEMWGPDALMRLSAVVEWDVTPPQDQTAQATALTQASTAITTLTEALRAHGRELDIDTLTARFGIPVRGDLDGDGVPEAVGPTLSLVEDAA
jgi:hypothetical protein